MDGQDVHGWASLATDPLRGSQPRMVNSHNMCPSQAKLGFPRPWMDRMSMDGPVLQRTHYVGPNPEWSIAITCALPKPNWVFRGHGWTGCPWMGQSCNGPTT